MYTLAQMMQQQVEAHLEQLRRGRWLTFTGEEAVTILRKSIFLPRCPVLIVHCHQRLGFAPREYEHFVPRLFNASRRHGLVTISGVLGERESPLDIHWRPDRAFDESGTYLSGVSTLPGYFPQQALAAINVPENLI